MLPGNNCYTTIPNKIDKCAICKSDVMRGEDMVVERKTIHKNCFKCGYCGCTLQLGRCAIDHSLSRYGLIYFCGEHMLLGPGERLLSWTKLENLQERSECKLQYAIEDIRSMVHVIVAAQRQSVRTSITKWEEMSGACGLVNNSSIIAMQGPPELNLSNSSSVESSASSPSTDECNQPQIAANKCSDGPRKPKRSFLPLSLSMDDVSGRQRRIQQAKSMLLRKNSISSPHLCKTNQHFRFPNRRILSILRVQSERTHQEHQRDPTNEQNFNSKLVIGLAQEEMQAKLHWLFTNTPSTASGVSSRRQSPCSSKSLAVAGKAQVEEIKKKENKKYGRSWSTLFSGRKRNQSTSSAKVDGSELAIEVPKKGFFQSGRRQSLAPTLTYSITPSSPVPPSNTYKEQRRRRKSEAIPTSNKLISLFTASNSKTTTQETPTSKRRFHFRSSSRSYKPAEKAATTSEAANSTNFMNSPVMMLKNAIFPLKRADTSPEETARKPSTSSFNSLATQWDEENSLKNRSRSMSNAIGRLANEKTVLVQD
uniref:LIM zinc-binding domain-containing protein n=1 Tax=Ditylenchus dipsaci TaxID=166011 RepID=A0A915DXJ6_9BILA